MIVFIRIFVVAFFVTFVHARYLNAKLFVILDFYLNFTDFDA